MTRRRRGVRIDRRVRRGGRAAERAGLENRYTEIVTDDQNKTCDEGPEVLAPGLREDADLRSVVEAWSDLDEPIRAAIVQLCRVKAG